MYNHRRMVLLRVFLDFVDNGGFFEKLICMVRDEKCSGKTIENNYCCWRFNILVCNVKVKEIPVTECKSRSHD